MKDVGGQIRGGDSAPLHVVLSDFGSDGNIIGRYHHLDAGCGVGARFASAGCDTRCSSRLRPEQGPQSQSTKAGCDSCLLLRVMTRRRAWLRPPNSPCCQLAVDAADSVSCHDGLNKPSRMRQSGNIPASALRSSAANLTAARAGQLR